MKDLKILIAEDEQFNRELYMDSFEEGGFDTVEAENGEVALDKLKADNSIDILLLDINMPVLDGLETLQQVRKNPEIYGRPLVVMLTSLSSDNSINKSYDIKADGYLIKQEYLPDEIVEEVLGIYKEQKINLSKENHLDK